MDAQATSTCLESLGQRTGFGSFALSAHLQPGRQGKNEEDENEDDDDDDLTASAKREQFAYFW